MKRIYLILAHNNPVQLKRLISRLDDGDTIFYIHIDLKSNMYQFARLIEGDNIFFIKPRVNCIWADFSIVLATLNLIDVALSNHSEGMCILMSVSDYPIKSLSHIDLFLKNNYDKIFIDIQGTGPNILGKEFNKRVYLYKVNLTSNRGHFLQVKGLNLYTIYVYLRKKINFSQFLRIVFVKPKLKLDMELYHGSAWWAMNVQNLNKIYDFVQDNKKTLFDFCKYTTFPDEFFFQSIIMHLEDKDLNNNFFIEKSLTYVDWGEDGDALYEKLGPVRLDINHLSKLLKKPKNKLFARKFDLTIDTDIFDKLDSL